MFNLLVMSGGWPPYQSTFSRSRIFEYTDDHISASFREGAQINYQSLIQLPALFMPEQNSGDNMARVGQITRATAYGGADVTLEYSFDVNFPPISVDWIASISNELHMADWEFGRTHWAVKDVDLFRVLFRAINPRRNRPTVFQLSEAADIDPRQLSVMMPFDAGFNSVYATLQSVGAATGMQVNRADDIWIHHQIIQDVVTLIDKSRIVIADCTHRNANVFYEIGIAHAIGREVILITQNIEHIPFDLRHLRAVTYLNNGEGLQRLEAALVERIRTLIGS